MSDEIKPAYSRTEQITTL